MYTTKNTLADNARKASIALLQSQLFNAVDLSSQAKQAHWNVKGSNFLALHDLFDKIHGELNGHADLIAERLVSLGGQAHGTIRAVSTSSSLPEYPLDISAQELHIEALSSALAAFGSSIRQASDTSSDSGDQNTSDLFTEIARAVDKSLWFVEAHAG